MLVGLVITVVCIVLIAKAQSPLPTATSNGKENQRYQLIVNQGGTSIMVDTMTGRSWRLIIGRNKTIAFCDTAYETLDGRLTLVPIETTVEVYVPTADSKSANEPISSQLSIPSKLEQEALR